MNRSTTQKGGIKMFCLLVMFVYGIKTYYPEVVIKIRKLYTTFSKRYHINLENFNGRIFLCDEKVVSNIYDFCFLLSKHNFLYLNVTTTPFYELVQVLNKTELIISADVDNLVIINFMKRGSSILELTRKQTNEIDKSSLRYFNLASSLKLKYYYQVCPPVKKSNLKVYSKIEVDLKILEKNIKLMQFKRGYSVD